MFRIWQWLSICNYLCSSALQCTSYLRIVWLVRCLKVVAFSAGCLCMIFHKISLLLRFSAGTSKDFAQCTLWYWCISLLVRYMHIQSDFSCYSNSLISFYMPVSLVCTVLLHFVKICLEEFVVAFSGSKVYHVLISLACFSIFYKWFSRFSQKQCCFVKYIYCFCFLSPYFNDNCETMYNM